MTRPIEVVTQSLELAAQGLSTSEVARRLGVPRSTVRDWLAGRLPLDWHRGGTGCTACSPEHDPDELPPAYVYLLGMRAVMPHNRVGRVGYGTWHELYAYSKHWPCLFPQHGPGRKHERQIALTDWQRRLVARWPALLLRGLIHSDGCRFQNTGRGWSHPRYSFANLSEGIKSIFCDACDLMGLHWTRSGEKTIYVSRKADVEVLDRFVGPKG